MAIWTLAQYEALKAAIAQGATRVEYQDKAVTYRSLDEMLRLLRQMEESLGLKEKGGGRKYAVVDKGLGS